MRKTDNVDLYMSDNQSKTAIVRLGADQISRYSNALVKRALDEIAIKSPEPLGSLVMGERILIIGAEVGPLLADMLSTDGFNSRFIESYGPPFDQILSELSQNGYDMVIVSYWAAYQVLPEIRNRFPKLAILFLTSYYGAPVFPFLEQHGFNVGDFIPVPFDYVDLLSR